ncbi:MAG TPA: molybdopterin molybdenumtransferase MoeA [Methanothermococcus okinawensis]|uniref:Molybdopterin molybdenumtransferase MoeA n=1 Tax=Methanothermococcus okinawensis TaxID=155863 RepID=A0A833A718_9EURY|nr:molybdopterin molybdenumtransferase MoeA [Methanothermococcus okinawensis]
MFLKNLMPYRRARDIVFNTLEKVIERGIETVPVYEAWNRICAEDILSPEDLPMFNRAAMDGYGVIAEDTFGASETNPVILDLLEDPDKPVEKGQCVKLSTGMPIPQGVDAVVMKEYCIEGEGFVEVRRGVHPYENVSRRGEDIKRGEVIVKRGEVITPYHIGMLSSLGIKRVKIYHLSVGIISIGDELIDLEDFTNIEELKSKRYIVNSNTPMFYALIGELGFTPKMYRSVRDEKGEIEEVLLRAVKENDVVITTGGTSVGERDYTVEVVRDIGKLIFHGVQIRPGKPFGFGVCSLGDREVPLYILSGYPVAAVVQFELFFRSYFKRRRSVYLPLRRGIPSTVGRTDVVRVKLVSENRKTYVEPLRIRGSGVLSSLRDGEGYILVDENIEGYEKGDYVKVYLF